MCLDLAEKYRQENDGKWINQNTLQKLTKKCVPLHSKNIQHVLIKYLTARDAILKAKNAGRTDEKYPYKKKNYYVTGWDVQSIKVDYENGLIKLSKPEYFDENGTKKRQDPVVCQVKSLPNNIVQVELVYRNKLYLCIKYTEEVEYLQIYSNNTASIDLGEIHSITSIDSSGNAIIITGRLMRSIKQLRNKEQAKIYKRLSKCTKGSRQYKKYMVALTDLSVKTNRKINDCIHKISKLYLDFCILNNISTIYYGDLDSATRSTRQKKKGKGLVRQKLSQWNFGYLMARIENRLTKHGIIAIKVKEYYTSSKCPSCTKLNKPKNREYVCSCGYKQHRDIVGAINILNDNGGYTLKYYKNKKYLQIV